MQALTEQHMQAVMLGSLLHPVDINHIFVLTSLTLPLHEPRIQEVGTPKERLRPSFYHRQPWTDLQEVLQLKADAVPPRVDHVATR